MRAVQEDLREHKVGLSFAKACVFAFGLHTAFVLASLLLPSRAVAGPARDDEAFFTVSIASEGEPESPTLPGQSAESPEPGDPIAVKKPAAPTLKLRMVARPIADPDGVGAPNTAALSAAHVQEAPSSASRNEMPSEGQGAAEPGPTPVGGGAGGKSELTGTGAKGGKEAESVLAFGPGMTRPSLLSKTDPTYTREALAASVQGLMLVKCTITLQGALEGCRIVKSLPHMDAAVLTALTNWRYAPVTYQGRAVAVDYVIPVRLVLQ